MQLDEVINLCGESEDLFTNPVSGELYFVKDGVIHTFLPDVPICTEAELSVDELISDEWRFVPWENPVYSEFKLIMRR